MSNRSNRVLVTGSAGFIGFHLCKLLLDEGYEVRGYDAMTDYYDVALKEARHRILYGHVNFSATIGMLENQELLDKVADEFKPSIIVHLAAQAGVRFSLENPRAYLNANVIGTFNVMEVARRLKVEHLLMASTSSIYGANEAMPFRETDKADTQLTFYAASKKATESMSHSYAHLWRLPTTMFRFFTVYGPWGRPDMALFKFADAMLENREIDIYNEGEMYRDFTYVTDLVYAIRRLIDVAPSAGDSGSPTVLQDSVSAVAPWRVVNIGNSNKVRLLDLIEALEHSLGIKAEKNFMPMQPGDVPATWADCSLLHELTGFRPNTDIGVGVPKFVAWFLEYRKESHTVEP